MHRRPMRWLPALVALLFLGQAALMAVAAAANFEIVPSASEARYRVREQLAGLNFPNDAIGTTKSISGMIVLDTHGRPAPGSKITVDLRTLRSDEGRRDNYLHQNTLTTATFPRAEFVPRELRGLPNPLPRSGQANVQILGDMTLRNVTGR